MTPDERAEALATIAADVAACTRCPLAAGRTRAVPGDGHPETEVVFVGEGPGYHEDQQGRPFVGAAGNLLNEMLGAIGWRRDEVFVTNVVKCRPPGNRDPEPAEIAACAPFLRRQLEVLDPAVVVSLGRHSLQTFMPGARIGAAHGTVRPVDPETGAANALTLAMYHPAAALRQQSLRETMLADMARLPQALLDARARREAPTRQPEPVRAPPTEPEPAVAEVAVAEPLVAPAPAALAETQVALAETPLVAAATAHSADDDQMELFG